MRTWMLAFVSATTKIAETKQGRSTVKLAAPVAIGAILLTLLTGATNPPADIVVTGTRRDPAVIRDAVHTFVRAVAAAPIDDQLARWHAPVCVRVHGLDPVLAARLTARVTAVAQDAGAPVADTPCRANIVIVFSLDARTLLAVMEGKKPRLLVDATAAERIRLRSAAAPVRWWYAAIGEGADGRPLLPESSALLGANLPVGDDTRFLDTTHTSLIGTNFRSSLVSAVVLVDAPLATGFKLDAFADYAAFVALAHVRPLAAAGTAPSIMTLFAGGESAPDRMTAWDCAYLAALYRTPPDRVAAEQNSRIMAAMTVALTRSAPNAP